MCCACVLLDFEIDMGANMNPKTHPKSIQDSFKFDTKFDFMFCLIFHWFWMVFFGVGHAAARARQPDGWIVRPPKPRIFKDKPKTKPKTKTKTKTKTKHVWNTLARLRASAVADFWKVEPKL